MLTPKYRRLIIVAWLILWLVGLGYYYYSRRQVKVEEQRAALAAAVSAAAEKEKEAAEEGQRINEKIQVQAKHMAALQLAKGFGGVLTPEEETSPVSGLLGQRPPADLPIPPIIPAAESYISNHALTATSIDSTPYAVIDQHRYRVGDRVVLGPDQALFVCAIKDGFVIFAGGDHKFKMQLVLSK
jgi:hypothetical protein